MNKLKVFIRALALLMLSATLVFSTTGCNDSEDVGGKWVESEVIIYEDVSAEAQTDEGETDTTSKNQTENTVSKTETASTVSKEQSSSSSNANALPKTLANPNVTVFWPVTVDDHPEFTAINKAFEKKYGGKVTVVGAGNYDDRTVRLTNLIQSKTQVDVVISQNEDYPSYPISKLIRPMDESKFDFTKSPYLINKSSVQTKFRDKFYYVTGDSIYTGKYLLYNKTLFNNAGEKTPDQLYKEGKWNWNTFREAARNLTQDTNNDGKTDIYGYADYDINAFLTSNGTSLLKNDGKGNWKVNSDEQVTNAYQLYFDMYNVDRSICTDPWSWSNDMKIGKLAMVHQSPRQFLSWKSQGSKFEYDFVPMAKGSDAKTYFGGKGTVGSSFAMGATCKNPEGTYAYIKFFIESSANEIYNEWTGSAKYTSEQIKKFEEYSKLPSGKVSPIGFGNLKMDARTLLWDIRGGKSVGSSLEYWNRVLQQDIDIALMTN